MAHERLAHERIGTRTDREVEMPGKRRGSRVTKATGQPRRVTSTGMAVGLSGLAVVAMVGVSVLVARSVNPYTAGLMLGIGVATTASILYARRRLARRPRRAPGVSRTRDCRQARWSAPSKPFGAPHVPTAAQRRVRPCPGSRRI